MTERDKPVELRDVYEACLSMERTVQQQYEELLGRAGKLERFDRELRAVKDYVTSMALRLGIVEEPVQPDPSNDVCVLVVDDEPTLITTLPRILSQYGFITVTARGGKEAIELLDTEARVDVVLCDLNMPGNGSTLCRHVLKQHPELTVVIMSGLEERTVARYALELGATHYITKPFPPTESVVLTLKAAGRLARDRRMRLMTIAPPVAAENQEEAG